MRGGLKATGPRHSPGSRISNGGRVVEGARSWTQIAGAACFNRTVAGSHKVLRQAADVVAISRHIYQECGLGNLLKWRGEVLGTGRIQAHRTKKLANSHWQPRLYWLKMIPIMRRFLVKALQAARL